MAYLQKLDTHLGARYSPHTRRAFLAYARQFLADVGEKPTYSREEVLGYVDELIRRHYKANTITNYLTGIRALFDVNNLTWPLNKRDARLGLPQSDTIAPVLLPDEMHKLILGIKGEPGLPRAAAALGTVYGLRGDEIVRILAQGCDGVRLEIQTAKGGRERKHVIPRPLAPALTFAPTTVSIRYLHGVYEHLMKEHVRPPVSREGWHAVRRAVVTGLFDAGLEQHVVHAWLGWRIKSDISLRYYRPEPLALDRAVYARHPYLRTWL